MRHPTPSRGRRVLLAAAAALLALGGLTAPASAMPGGALPAATTVGCGRPAGLATGTHTLTSGGQSRSFRLDVPSGYDPNRPYRLVVGLHWWHGTAADVVNQGFYGLKPLAGTSTVFVAPQGIDNAWPNTNGQDVTFVDDVLRTVESALCIDTTQRFATGFSYGGGMSNALACARADVFRAVAVLNGAQLSGCAGGTQPIAYLGSHGVVDSVLNISQGRALRDRALRNNGCQAQQAPEPAAGSGTHTRTAYTCRDGFPVVWLASDSDHQWDARDRGQQQSWVPGEIWRFFSSLTSTTRPRRPRRRRRRRRRPRPTPTPDAHADRHPDADHTAPRRRLLGDLPHGELLARWVPGRGDRPGRLRRDVLERELAPVRRAGGPGVERHGDDAGRPRRRPERGLERPAAGRWHHDLRPARQRHLADAVADVHELVRVTAPRGATRERGQVSVGERLRAEDVGAWPERHGGAGRRRPG